MPRSVHKPQQQVVVDPLGVFETVTGNLMGQVFGGRIVQRIDRAGLVFRSARGQPQRLDAGTHGAAENIGLDKLVEDVHPLLVGDRRACHVIEHAQSRLPVLHGLVDGRANKINRDLRRMLSGDTELLFQGCRPVHTNEPQKPEGEGRPKGPVETVLEGKQVPEHIAHAAGQLLVRESKLSKEPGAVARNHGLLGVTRQATRLQGRLCSFQKNAVLDEPILLRSDAETLPRVLAKVSELGNRGVQGRMLQLELHDIVIPRTRLISLTTHDLVPVVLVVSVNVPILSLFGVVVNDKSLFC